LYLGLQLLFGWWIDDGGHSSHLMEAKCTRNARSRLAR
jgi:hypothetical protein